MTASTSSLNFYASSFKNDLVNLVVLSELVIILDDKKAKPNGGT